MPRFDQVVGIIRELLGEFLRGIPAEVTIVRDVTGSATVVLPDKSLDEDQLNGLAEQLHGALGHYSPGPQRVLLRHSDLIDANDVLASQDRVELPDGPRIWLVDRLLTNQDWLRPAVVDKPRVPTATAFSIKGGVGRSTAFAVWAWYLARLGKRVLVVDLDLEAPGIGSILLDELPDAGLVDWLVETLAEEADVETLAEEADVDAQARAALLGEMLATSPLAADTPGSIHVIPAYGAKTQDYVAKLGRIYAPTITAEGVTQGFAHRLAALVEQAGRRLEPPDVVLLDARAGLHDIGAAAVTQLGAEVFLFARNDAQSWDAYEKLFDHLRMARTVEWGMPDEDLRWRLKMVAAQLDASEDAIKEWVDPAYTSWSRFYDAERKEDEESKDLDEHKKAQTFDRTDETAPHHPLPIRFDTQLRGMRLAAPGARPDWAVVDSAFGQFLKGATERLFEAVESVPQEGSKL
jgi:CO dehydrogenase nickel-insertion accessory protein CooC1